MTAKGPLVENTLFVLVLAKFDYNSALMYNKLNYKIENLIALHLTEHNHYICIANINI